jgi:hypothetical protein
MNDLVYIRRESGGAAYLVRGLKRGDANPGWPGHGGVRCWSDDPMLAGFYRLTGTEGLLVGVTWPGKVLYIFCGSEK